MRRRENTGDASQGVIIFIEPVRWLFIIWGFLTIERGLRKAGVKHWVELFRWCTVPGSLLVIPDLVARRRLLMDAERLAARIRELRRQSPRTPVHLIAYSSGCYVALEACKRLDYEMRGGSVVLLAAAVSSIYNLEQLDRKVAAIHVFCSPLDVINIAGTLIFGTNDRMHRLPIGVVGLHDAPKFVHQRRWQPADVRLGYFGDHFTVTSPWFVQKRVAPLLTPPAQGSSREEAQ